MAVRNEKVLQFNIDATDNNNQTSLMKASFNNNAEIVDILLKYGANPRKQNFKGETALHMSALHENLVISQRLIVSMSQINQQD